MRLGAFGPALATLRVSRLLRLPSLARDAWGSTTGESASLHRDEERTLVGRTTCRSAGRSEVCEDCQYASVRGSVGLQAELEEDLLDVRLDGSLGDEQPLRDGSV